MAVVARDRRATWIFALLLCAALTANAVLRPQWDWDVLAYAGCAEQLRGGDTDGIHAAAYGALEADAPEEVVRDLRGESTAERAEGGPAARDYRLRMATDARAFEAQLPFYRGRVVFIGLLALASLLGIGVLHAAFAISLLSGLAFALILLRWTTRFLPVPVAIAATLACVLLTGAPQVMSMGTPDMLAASFVLGGAYLLAESPRRIGAVVLLALAIATRANHAILAALLLLWSASQIPSSRRFTVRIIDGSMLVLIFVGLFCTQGRDTYPWWTVFHHSFVEYTVFPAAQTPPSDWGFALDRAWRSLPMFKAWQPLLFTLCGLAAIVIGARSRAWNSRPARLAAFVLLAIALNFALFPALWPRLMVAPWTLLWVALLCAQRDRIRRVPSAAPVTMV